MQRTDVLIVGAGVAGLFSALHLSAKYKVLIVEKQPFPAEKLCAGLLCEEAFACLAELHPPESLFYQPALLQARVEDVDNGLSFTSPDRFHNLKRSAFYTWLASQLGGHVSIQDRRKVKAFTEKPAGIQVHFTEGEPLETRYLIGADGFHSVVRRQFFHSRPSFIHSVQYTIELHSPLPSAFFLFQHSFCREYYTWVVPRDGRIVAGTAIEGSNYLQLPSLLAEAYGLHGTVLEKRGHPLTKLRSLEEVTPGKGRVLLTGEAAGLVRPTSGEGLTMALKSAQLAAAAVNRGGTAPAREYAKACRSLHPRLLRDLQSANVMFDPAARRRVFAQ